MQFEFGFGYIVQRKNILCQNATVNLDNASTVTVQRFIVIEPDKVRLTGHKNGRSTILKLV